VWFAAPSGGRAATFLRNYVITGVLVLLAGFVVYTQWILRGLEANNRALIEPLAELAAYLPAIGDREESNLIRQIVSGVAEYGRVRFIITDSAGMPVVARGTDADLEAALDADQPLSDAQLKRVRGRLRQMEAAAEPIGVRFALVEGRRVVGRIYYGDVDSSELVNMPFVLCDVDGRPIAWRLYGGFETVATHPANAVRAEGLKRDAERDRRYRELQVDPPLETGRFYYELRPLRSLMLMPFAQTLIIGGFVFGGVILYRRLRMDEQAAIWTGLAKESAHQLGTPVSSLMGWVDLAKELRDGRHEGANAPDIYDEMSRDLTRLQRIVSRFAQVGQEPKRTAVAVNAVLSDAVGYFRERLPSRSKRIELVEQYDDVPAVVANEDLLQWVVENLIRNALDAIESSAKPVGRVVVSSRYEARSRCVIIRVDDNGGGIPRADHRRVFSPGFTTKKHGWGVGLTLAKRIVETYHDGSIRIVSSDSTGTSFEVRLPQATNSA
jgi:hypothetical protein